MDQKPAHTIHLGIVCTFIGAALLILVVISRIIGATLHTLWVAPLFMQGPQLSFIFAVLGYLVTRTRTTSASTDSGQPSSEVIADRRTRHFAIDVVCAALILILFTWAPTPLQTFGIAYPKTPVPTPTPSTQFVLLEQATLAPIVTTPAPETGGNDGTPILLPTFIPYTPTPMPTSTPIIPDTPTPSSTSITATVTVTSTPTNTVVPLPTNTASPMFAFTIAPQSVVQSCVNKNTILRATTVLLDNTRSTGSVSWQLTVTERDPLNKLWASGNPLSGSVGAGRTATMTLVPYQKLCSDMVARSVVLYHALVTYTGGQASISDTIAAP